MPNLKITLILFLSTLFAQKAHACLILCYKDANHVFVANHEDWFAKDAAVKINPPFPGVYGSIVFTFLSEGWAQGGMNEKGLFFDAAYTPYQEIEFSGDARAPQQYIWQEILDHAATVGEAVLIVQKYKVEELREASIMIADANGDAAVIGAHNHRLDVRRITGNYLMQTNFNSWQPELSDEPVCTRYQAAALQLSSSPPVTAETLKSILEKTHQDSLTVYSNIYDLKGKTILTYNKRDFSHPISISMADYFRYGDCMVLLDSIQRNNNALEGCLVLNTNPLTVRGVVLDEETEHPVPFVNIGLFGKNLGTLSDEDGTFEITLPVSAKGDSLLFSSVGFTPRRISVRDLWTTHLPLKVALVPNTTLLPSITITAKNDSHVMRLGWMGGKDGVLPLDTIMGGGAVALLVESPAAPFHVKKLQVRLMYNSCDTLRLRFHIYFFDSIADKPGRELLTHEIILRETKKFGWLRFDLAKEDVIIFEKRVFIAFEWIDDRQRRSDMLKGLREWEAWRKDQFNSKNKKVEFIPSADQNSGQYKYHGNMMDWPGFSALPPFTGLMVETGKNVKTAALRTFERKTSFGTWTELSSTLNAVITISY